MRSLKQIFDDVFRGRDIWAKGYMKLSKRLLELGDTEFAKESLNAIEAQLKEHGLVAKDKEGEDKCKK